MYRDKLTFTFTFIVILNVEDLSTVAIKNTISHSVTAVVYTDVS